MPLGVALLAALAAASGALANSNPTDSSGVDACPGYTATNVVTSGPNLTASLVLAGEVCNAYGPDIETLNLQVTYETGASEGALQRGYMRLIYLRSLSYAHSCQDHRCQRHAL